MIGASVFGLGGTSSISALPVYQRLIRANMEDEVAKFAKRPKVKQDIAYFRAKMAELKTPEEFIKNPRLLTMALTGYGMESQAAYPARIKQVLMSDPDDKYSVANRMSDERYRVIAKDFDFFNQGTKQLNKPEFADYLVDRYLKVEYEKDAGNLNPALTDALYFRRTIQTYTKTAQLYGDIALFDVVKETLNIPNGVVTGPVSALTTRIERGFDIARVKEPGYVDKFVQRYLAMKSLGSQQSSGSLLSGMLA
jgi:Protein of unknown function (DUF1217)